MTPPPTTRLLIQKNRFLQPAEYSLVSLHLVRPHNDQAGDQQLLPPILSPLLLQSLPPWALQNELPQVFLRNILPSSKLLEIHPEGENEIGLRLRGKVQSPQLPELCGRQKTQATAQLEHRRLGLRLEGLKNLEGKAGGLKK